MAASLRAAAVLCLRDLKREAVDLGHQCLGQPEGKTLPGGTLDFLPGNGFAIAGRYVVYVHFTFMPCFVTHFAVRYFFCLKSICKYWGRRIEMYPTYYIDGLYFSTFHADVKVTCVHTYRQPKIVACEFFPKEGTNFQTKVSMLKSDCKVFYLSVRSTYTRRFAWKNLAKIKKRKKNIRNSMSMSIFVPFFKQIDLCETTNVVHLRSIWCFLQVS